MDKDATASAEYGTQVWRRATRLYDQFLQTADDPRENFDTVLQRQPATIRAAFESLRQGDRRACEESFLAALPLDAPAGPPADARIGTQVGPYRIEELIAEGGNGIVYRARRCSDYEQTVAIKVLSSRLLHGRGRARFQAEKQALARLVHPHICRLLDAGDTADGAPFLVMEYINGGPIDQYCQPRDTSLRDRLTWFADVCRAVAFAHNNGILHRDLKPSNVLIDATQRVRVTDFGLAKTLEDEAGQAGVTVTGEILGTPGYMAPEQAFRQLGEVSVATDVYGLGAVLYALLVDRPPFRGDSIAGTLLMVKEQEPLSPRALRRHVSRDLETICLRCLQKRPADRYTTVDALLGDVERYLADRPITARPVGPGERLVRWTRRYPALASLTGALVAVTLTALVVLSVLLAAARRDRAEALLQRGRARAVVDAMFTDVSKWLAEQPHSTAIRAKLLLAAKEHYEQFAREQSDDPAVMTEAATAWFRLGKIQGALGNTAGREQAAREALRRFQKLSRQFPERHEYRFDVFHCYFLLHDKENAYRTIHQLVAEQVDDPRGEYRSALVTMATQLSQSYVWRDAGRAAELIAESERVAQSLREEFPDRPEYVSQRYVVSAARARWHLVQQEYAAAAAAARQAVEWCQRRQAEVPLTYGDAAKFQACYELQAGAAWHLGDGAAAAAAAEQSVQATRQAAEYFSASSMQSLLLARALQFRRMIFQALGDAEQASQAAREEQELLEKALDKWPEQQQFAARLACLLVTCPDPALRDPQRARELIASIDLNDVSQRLPLHLAQLRLGNPQPLLDYLDSTAADNRLLRAYRALACALQGNLARARVEYQRIPEAPPTFNLSMDLPAEPILEEVEALLQGT